MAVSFIFGRHYKFCECHVSVIADYINSFDRLSGVIIESFFKLTTIVNLEEELVNELFLPSRPTHSL